jgi:DinB superfamily
MDLALQLVIEMNQWIWSRFKDDLKDATPEEIDWRPLPQANNISAIVRHLRIEAAWHLASLEHGEPMPVQLTDQVRQQLDLAPTNFQRNFKELEESYTRFIAVLGGTTAAALEPRTMTAYQNLPSGVSRPMHLLGFHQATHLATHLGQIRSILNLYRKTRGDTARFSPENLSFPL